MNRLGDRMATLDAAMPERPLSLRHRCLRAIRVRGVVSLAGAVLLLAAPGRCEDLEAEGDRYFSHFDNVRAMECYRRAYENATTNAQILAKLTWACSNIGEDLAGSASEPYYESAVAYAEDLEALAPENAKTYFLLAMTKGNLALCRGGREKLTLSGNIERDARRCVELDPTYSPGYTTLGVYYREVATLNWFLKLVAQELLGGLPNGSLELSEAMLLKAITADAGNVYAHYQLALTYEAMKKPQKALEYHRRVLALPIVDHQDPQFRRASQERIARLAD